MNVIILTVVLILSSFRSNIFAYGSSSSKKACTKPVFTQFTPVHLAVVAPQSEFSFLASALTNPKTIEVNVKKQLVDVTINKINKGYSVVGIMPESLQSGTFARVNIKAKGTNKCVGNDGWLLKIGE